jgi:benzylsuccinate CoA-transferase BbsF subunit
MSQGVFEGIKVLDFGWNAVVPVSIRYLAHQGATVVHVETSTHPDASRSVPPYKGGTTGLNKAPFWTEFNTNKYGLALNMNHPRGLEVAHDLVRWADVVAESYAPGVTPRWKLDYPHVKELNPKVIMLSGTMQGQDGPNSKHPGFGNVLVALSGLTHILGYQDGGPVQPYGAYTDWVAARFAAMAIIAALDYRRRTGQGQYLDVSQYESSLLFLTPMLLDYSVNGRVFQRRGNASSVFAPHGAYRCQGKDRWCAIAVTNEEEWGSFCRVLGNPEWTREERFSTFLQRKKNEEELNRKVEEWTLRRTAEEVMKLLQAAGVPAGLAATGEDLFKDPQLKYRNHFTVVDHPEIGI